MRNFRVFGEKTLGGYTRECGAPMVSDANKRLMEPGGRRDVNSTHQGLGERRSGQPEEDAREQVCRTV